jgi:Ca2+/H+ antiporter
VFVAAKDKMDLSLGVAIGSSIQVRLATCHSSWLCCV